MNSDLLSVKRITPADLSVAGFAGNMTLPGAPERGVCFMRAAGDHSALADELLYMEKAIYERGVAYARAPAPGNISSADDAGFYAAAAKSLLSAGRPATRQVTSEQGRNLLAKAASDICAGYLRISGRAVSDSMKESFAANLLFRADSLIALLGGESFLGREAKLCAFNVSDTRKYLVFALMNRLGADILLIQNEKDIDASADSLRLSDRFVLGAFAKRSFPAQYRPPAMAVPAVRTSPDRSGTAASGTGNIPVKIPERPRRSISAAQAPTTVHNSKPVMNSVTGTVPAVQQAMQRTPAADRVKTMEELAMLASSVVMIYVADSAGKVRSSGSGIMVSRKGYILTNSHVVSGGAAFTVRIENDDNVYTTDELIKTHIHNDLALIRIDRALSPLDVCAQPGSLVRGQKVVAIGSPLGMFNTVSDGIISGFRDIDDVKMIQFTAPISPGSSGGALLDMYGRVVGICTAGIGDGQNLNLAVSCEYILPFIRGFI